MKIGIDARFYSPSATGIGRYVYELIRNLASKETNHSFYIFLRKKDFDDFVPPAKHFHKVLADCAHYSLCEQTKFWRILSMAKLDLMHFTHFNGPILYRRPSVVTIHDLTLNKFPGNKMNSMVSRIAYNLVLSSIVHRSKKIISVSQHTQKDITEILHIPKEKIAVIYPGIDQSFHHITNEKIITDTLGTYQIARPYLLYTGVWRSHKNLVNLVRAFALLRESGAFNGELVLTGKEDPWYPEVREEVRKHKLEGLVRFTGFVPDEDLVVLYCAASVYVFPSLYEGFGLPVLEAFACGTPVAASRSSSIPEVTGPDAAELFEPQDPKDMARAIEKIVSNPEHATELIEKGRNRVKDFSWSHMADQILEVYNKALHSKA